MSEAQITSFCVYGTLRDDDDSGATWTESFLVGLPQGSAKSAIVRGFRLKRNTVDNYPYAFLTNDPEDFIHVRVLTFPKELFQEKLVEADKIEMYDAENIADSIYFRTIVTPCTNDSQELLPSCYMYHINKYSLDLKWYDVEENDWMKRDRDFFKKLAVNHN